MTCERRKEAGDERKDATIEEEEEGELDDNEKKNNQ